MKVRSGFHAEVMPRSHPVNSSHKPHPVQAARSPLSPCLAVISSTSRSSSLAPRAVFGNKRFALVSNSSARLWGQSSWNNNGERRWGGTPAASAQQLYLGLPKKCPARCDQTHLPLQAFLLWLHHLHLAGGGGIVGQVALRVSTPEAPLLPVFCAW